ncbi:MAG TPA: choice-of-anchor D domain-containing protein [Verrucomicrobium sp.]|nr:choice-of-anchor D domain-containing protein [Verrucomicrobium sp.]
MEEAAGGEMVSGVSAVNFGSSVVGVPVTKTFTVRNIYQGLLTGVSTLVSGGQYGDYVVTEMPASQVSGGGSTTFTVTFTPQANGTRDSTLTLGSNDPDEGAFQITLRGSGITAQQGWRQTHFSTTSNFGNAADLFDFDGDGLVNLIEYAFALHPKQNSAGQTPQPVVEDGHLVIRFTAPAGVTGVIYGAMASPSLAADSWAPVADTGTNGVHEFKVPIVEGGNKFMKLTVTTNP